MDDPFQPTAKVAIAGTKGKMILDAVIDTGFDGFLCIPVDDAVALGLVLAGHAMIELADGTEKQEYFFKGSVTFFGKTRSARIYLTISEDALIGTRLFAGCRLVIDFPKNEVEVTRTATEPKN